MNLTQNKKLCKTTETFGAKAGGFLYPNKKTVEKRFYRSPLFFKS